MELNAEQIKKALECCTSPDGDDTCLLCPYGDVGLCTQLAMAHALALINQLTEENERLRAENERYEAENHETFNKWLKLEEATRKRHSALFEEAKIALKEDTVREMQERLKARKVSYGNITFKVVPIDDIDQIAKEMLEGNDG